MKTSLFAVGFIVAVCAYSSQAAFITQGRAVVRFRGAEPGIQTASEPLRFGADAADEVFLLDLGQYSTADVGQTFTFKRQPETMAEWEAVSSALRSSIGSFPTSGTPTMWLGLHQKEVDVVQTDVSFSMLFGPAFPTFSLQQVDITPRYFRRGTDDGNTFRTAEFDALFYWLVPEPATALLKLNCIAYLLSYRRRFH